MYRNENFIVNQSGAATWTSSWVPAKAAGWNSCSMGLEWTAVASTNGTFTIEGAETAAPAATSITTLTVTLAHGTFPAVGTSAGNCLVILDSCPAYIRVKWTRTAGGGANQFQGRMTLS